MLLHTVNRSHWYTDTLLAFKLVTRHKDGDFRTRASGMPRLLAMLCSYPHMPGTPDNTFTSHGAGDLPSLG